MNRELIKETAMAKINIGVVEGYFHGNNTETNDFIFNEIVMSCAKEVFGKTGIYVSFVSYETKTLYNKEWGCPSGGEKTYNLEAAMNKEFIKCSEEDWVETVVDIVELLKEEFKQSTVTVTFGETYMYYMK